MWYGSHAAYLLKGRLARHSTCLGLKEKATARQQENERERAREAAAGGSVSVSGVLGKSGWSRSRSLSRMWCAIGQPTTAIAPGARTFSPISVCLPLLGVARRSSSFVVNWCESDG